MPIYIECRRDHLALKKFAPVELSDLTILVGKNGVGKSQIANALRHGQVMAYLKSKSDELVAINRGQIVLLTNHDIESANQKVSVPTYLSRGVGGGRAVESQYTHPDFLMLNQKFDQLRSTMLQQIAREIGNYIALVDLDVEADDDVLKTLVNLEKIEGLDDDVQNKIDGFREKANSILRRGGTRDQRSNPPEMQTFAVIVQDIERDTGIKPIQIDQALFDQYLLRTEYAMFAPSLPSLFGKYRDSYIENRLLQLEDGDEGTSKSLSNDDFIAKYGAKPWDVLTRSMKEFGLGYSFSSPPSSATEPYEPVLIRNDNGKPVSMDDLSSGEKVLLRFALALFKPDADKVKLIIPKMLILDEVDGPLHPDILAPLMAIIQRYVVGELGIKCLIITHSPVTVGLSDESSLFEISSLGAAPQRVAKSQAMNDLLRGVPTINMEWGGNRDVFVESTTDAEIYHILLSHVKASVKLDRSLHFLSTGISKQGAEQGTGCDAVKSVVAELSKGDNRSTLGLVDWDTVNVGDQRVKVMASGQAYSLENIIMNPFLIGCLLLREKSNLVDAFARFMDLTSATESDCQKLADEIIGKLYPSGIPQQSSSLKLLSGYSIMMPDELLLEKGHDLEKVLVDGIPYLNRFYGQGKPRGAAMKQIASTVIQDIPEFCPQVIADAFIELANSDILHTLDPIPNSP